MKKKNLFYLLLCVMSCVSVGCGIPSLDLKETQKTTLFLRKDHTVQHLAVESFDQPYYKEEECRNFLKEQIAQYNGQQKKKTVEEKGVRIKNGVARLLMEYADLQTYADFQKVETSCTSWEEALQRDLIPKLLVCAKTENTVAREEIKPKKKYQVFISKEEGLQVKVQGCICYYKNAIFLNDTMVQTQKGKTVVIFE